MIARVTLEIALRKEFDYVIPPELAGQVDVGSRVQVPFGPRKVLGVVTAVAEESEHTKLKPILKLIGAQTLVTPKVLALARWIAEGAKYDLHWSFVAPVRPPLSEVKNAAWPRNPIDRFILARLEREGLSPSPEALRGGTGGLPCLARTFNKRRSSAS